MKASKYSNTCQMHEQRGTFNGIDTCSIADYGNFNFCSKLLDKSEGRSIKNRPDTNALLTQLSNAHIISANVATTRREAAEKYARASILIFFLLEQPTSHWKHQ